MELYLVRHAIAEDHSASGNDADRALTEAGKEKLVQVVRGLRKLKIRPDLILTSPLRRARETAEIAARGLDGAKVDVLHELAPAIDTKALVSALRPHSRLRALALVGHQPGLGTLASFLLTGSEASIYIDFKKGGVAYMEAELSDEPAHCVLKWVATSKLLRSL